MADHHLRRLLNLKVVEGRFNVKDSEANQILPVGIHGMPDDDPVILRPPVSELVIRREAERPSDWRDAPPQLILPLHHGDGHPCDLA